MESSVGDRGNKIQQEGTQAVKLIADKHATLRSKLERAQQELTIKKQQLKLGKLFFEPVLELEFQCKKSTDVIFSGN